MPCAGKDRRRTYGRRLRLAVGIAAVWLPTAVAGASAHTIVSISFDDGLSSTPRAGKILASHGLPATFFLITGDVGTAGHLNWSGVAQLAAEGHEIGGHTVTHVDLPTRTPAEQEQQICGSRQALLEHGYPALSFAYPHGDFNAETLRILKSCGYTSARLFGDRQGGSDALDGTPVYPESFSMAFEGQPNPYELSVLGTNAEPVPLSYLEDSVTWGLEGWVIIALHGVCDYSGHPSECERETPECAVEAAECTPSTYGSVSPADLEAFATWLGEQPDLVVRTIGQVANDKTPPTTSIACDGAPCSSRPYNKAVSVSLSATDSESMVEKTTYTTDGSSPTISSATYTEPITVSQTTTLKFRSWDVRENAEPVRSQTITVDTIPPLTTIEAKPPGDSNSAKASFSFKANEPATFECKLDAGAFKACSSPEAVSALADGSHTFEVKATDTAGNLQTSPPSYTWTVDTIPPLTTIEAKPPGDSNSAKASFSFKANEPATFKCKLDAGAFKACTSPHVVSGLADGSHTFRVRATDVAGNVEASPPSVEWIVDTTPPVTTFESEPLISTNSTGVSVAFSANEPATFRCSLDEGESASCSSPHTATGLSVGWHILRVQATDAAGNVEHPPVSYTWTVSPLPGGGSGSSEASSGKPSSSDGPSTSARARANMAPPPPRLLLARRVNGSVLLHGLPVKLHCSGPCNATVIVRARQAASSAGGRRLRRRVSVAIRLTVQRMGTIGRRVMLVRRSAAAIRKGPLRKVQLTVVAAVRMGDGRSVRLHAVVLLRTRLLLQLI